MASFINIHGDSVNIESLLTTKRTRAAKIHDPKHKGFRVSGVSQERISKARLDHERNSAHQLKSLGLESPEFNKQEWLRNAKLERITKKACETYDGAQAYKELAEKSGWLNVQIEALAKVK